MEAREINKKIATDVMGWKADLGYYFSDDESTSKWCQVRDWQPSTRIDHAFEVVEKICAGPMIYEFMLWKYTSGWEAAFSRHFPNNAPEMFNEIADTPAMAICLAALEAVKVQYK